MHAHDVRERDFTLHYEHDAAGGWHVARDGEDHDQRLSIMVLEEG